MVVCLITLISLYGALLAFLNISSIIPFKKGLLLPSHCLERGFFSTLAYSLLPAAFADMDGINYSQIAYADLVTIRKTISSQNETGGKGKAKNFELTHTYKRGTQQNVFYRKLVIELKGDRRKYVIREDYCQGYNDFEIVAGLLQHNGIPVVSKNNY